MNNFREWLSDNLRYIELILGIIAVIIGLFFGIRAIAGAISRGANTGKYNEDSIVAEAASNASLTKKASSGSVSTSSDASSAVSSASSAFGSSAFASGAGFTSSFLGSISAILSLLFILLLSLIMPLKTPSIEALTSVLSM